MIGIDNAHHEALATNGKNARSKRAKGGSIAGCEVQRRQLTPHAPRPISSMRHAAAQAASSMRAASRCLAARATKRSSSQRGLPATWACSCQRPPPELLQQTRGHAATASPPTRHHPVGTSAVRQPRPLPRLLECRPSAGRPSGRSPLPADVHPAARSSPSATASARLRVTGPKVKPTPRAASAVHAHNGGCGAPGVSPCAGPRANRSGRCSGRRHRGPLGAASTTAAGSALALACS